MSSLEDRGVIADFDFYILSDTNDPDLWVEEELAFARLRGLTRHPDRLFYRIETRRFDARWFHWIDADSGRIIREYNAIHTGTGTGVKGGRVEHQHCSSFLPQ